MIVYGAAVGTGGFTPSGSAPTAVGKTQTATAMRALKFPTGRVSLIVSRLPRTRTPAAALALPASTAFAPTMSLRSAA